MNDCCSPKPHSRGRALWIVMGVVALVLASTCLKASEPALYLEGGLGRKRGDFGTPIVSQLSAAYGTVGYASSTFDLNVTLPVLRLEVQGGGQSDSATGVGDVLFRGIRRFVPETDSGFAFDGGLALKLPTANSDKGLGTGKTDVGGFLAAHQRWDRLQIMLLGGWIQSASMNNATTQTTRSGIYTVGAGLSYYLERTKCSIAYEARGSQYSGVAGPREVSLDVFHLMGQRLALKGSFIAGLSDGSPKTAFGLGLVYWP